jgi:hypothetical protein
MKNCRLYADSTLLLEVKSDSCFSETFFDRQDFRDGVNCWELFSIVASYEILDYRMDSYSPYDCQ